MKRVVFGTAALGSRTTQATARAILRAARDAGFRSFDTAPFYGAGHAEELVGSLGPEVEVSTKFGSRPPAFLRFMAIRIARAESPRQWAPPPALWRDCGDMRSISQTMDRSAGLLAGCAKGCMFLHTPEEFPGAERVAVLVDMVKQHGFVPGVSSPALGDVLEWGRVLPPDGRIQLHFDAMEAAPASAMEFLAARQVWIHGIFSPSARARSVGAAARQALAAKWARELPAMRFVLTTTRLDGFARLCDFAALLERQG
jgi:hypothetical protein